MHQCIKCKRTYEGEFTELLLYFYPSETNKNKLHKYCKECMVNEDRINRSKRYRENPTLYILTQCLRAAKQRARRRGLEFSINIEWALSEFSLTNGKCPLCKKTFDVSEKRNRRDAISFDKFDNSAGYTEDNTVIICFECNWIKAARTIEEFENLGKNIINWINLHKASS